MSGDVELARAYIGLAFLTMAVWGIADCLLEMARDWWMRRYER